MTAFEEIRDQLRAALMDRIDREMVSEIEDIVCVTLGNFDITRKETSVVLYDGGDSDIMKRYFLAKAIQGCTKATAETYNTVLKSFFGTVNRHIKEVTSDDIRLYLAHKKIEKCSDAYLAVIYRTLSSFYKWCAAEDIIDKDPVAKVEKIKTRRKVEDALTEEQMELLRYTAANKRDKAIIEFLYSTGCRVSELCSVKKGDINFETNELEVLGKGRKYRKVYLTQRCRFALQDYLSSRTDNCEYLFVSRYEDMKPGIRKYLLDTKGVIPLQKSGVEVMIRTLGKKCGLPLHPHLIRKTVATQALRKGMPIDQVRVMLGHENIATTTIYAQTHQEEVKRSHEKYV